MPDKFIVPQFIENEDKILGPITVRQFILSLATAFLLFIWFKLLTLPYFIFAAIITVAIGGTFGFVKVNGQPFHIFFLNFLQTMLQPPLRVWDKTPTTEDLKRMLMPQVITEEAKGSTRKPRPGSTRLRDLSLTVNTGGVYRPEDENGTPI